MRYKLKMLKLGLWNVAKLKQAGQGMQSVNRKQAKCEFNWEENAILIANNLNDTHKVLPFMNLLLHKEFTEDFNKIRKHQVL